ncbi:Amino acid/polyamine transporter I family-containing protein [Strongyloides ratti]|uniref:Amino acid/polyamine transporter I family-containing protein n=1 Tax=Strongyloides ratti TaxID=34506 RepID=A0A090LNQ7_STRRB|nr:Amino acid/polyamine transporter I family-containing protein [Strongyloides ratti]CEF69804.1 Amino acid/polyamine transporter I family-containing protein [Strongyloides ratti]
MSTPEPCSKTSLTNEEKTNKENLVNRNSIGVLLAIGYIIGNVIGAGVFVAPTEVIRNTESAGLSMIVFSFAALTSLFGALSYAEIGSMITESGADFAYLCKINWKLVAFVFMISGCLILYPSIVAIQLQTFSEYFFKCFNIKFTDSYYANIYGKCLQIILLLIIILLNFQSLGKVVAKFNICASVCKIAAPATLIIIGIYFICSKDISNHWEHSLEHGNYKPLNLAVAFIAALFTFDGWDVLNFGAGELNNPRRNLPIAVIIGIFLITTIILSLNAAYYSILDLDTILTTTTVASTFVSKTFYIFEPIIPIVICIILIGSLNSSIFAASRFLQSAAEKKYLPKFISCKNGSSDSPRLALTLHALFVIIALFSGNIEFLLKFSGITQWCQRAVTVGALMWIRYKTPEYYNLKSTFKSPIIVPFIFFTTCISTVFTVAYEELSSVLFNFIIFIISGTIYLIFFDERLKKQKMLQKLKLYLHNFDKKLVVIAKIVFKCVPEEEDKMWFDQMLSGVITMGFVGGALYISYPLNKLDNKGRAYRRNYGTVDRIHNSKRDHRLTGNQYVISGLESIKG